MLALMKVGRGPGLVELREVAEPLAGTDEVLVAVEAAAICGTDLHILHDQHPYWPPVILGHEFAGTVVAVGEGVKGYGPGDRVVAETSTGSCGVCELCRSGNRHICSQKRAVGIGRHGAFARFLTVPVDLLHRVPEELSLQEAALTEPTAIAVHAVVERARIAPGESVVVLGAGPIGLLCLQVAQAAGAHPAVVSGRGRGSGVRLSVARDLGADAVVDVSEENLVERVAALTAGRGVDVVIETSGAPSAIRVLPELCRRLGRVCVVGVSGQSDVRFPWDAALFKGLEIQFSFSSRHTSWVTALRLLVAGRLRAAPLITRSAPLARWREAFAAQEGGRAVKMLLLPGVSDEP